MLRDRVVLFPRLVLSWWGSSDSPASAGRSLDRFYHFLAKGPGNMVEDSAQLGCTKLVLDVSYYESQIHVFTSDDTGAARFLLSK